ncbi:MAG TPA: MFS transporter [Kiloniellales bacterium]|nr:MFS transporter [Kiloniellales bacterium]
MATITVDAALTQIGTGRFQWRLLFIFGLVWTADAMQVLAIGLTAAPIAATFGITVPQALQTGTWFFIGMMVGAWGFGQLADRYGRRTVLIVTVLCDAVFGLASAAAPDLFWLCVLRFLTGAAVGGTLPVDYALMAEFLPPQRRGRWLVALEGFWAIGTLIVVVAAWLLSGTTDPWRWLFVVTGAPAVVGIFLRFWIPESPYHLSRRGEGAGARAVLERMARMNERGLPSGEVASEARRRPPFWELFRHGLARTSLMVFLVWFLVSAAYYGVFVWLPIELAKGGYAFVRGTEFLIWLALAQIPGYALAAVLVERIGRRATLLGFLVLSAIGCFLFTLAATPTLIAVSLLLMSFALLGTWGSMYAYTPELYPTELRGTGMGSAGAMARIGGLLAPLAIPYIVAISFATAIGLFAALLAVAAIATVLIPTETRAKPLT